MPRRPARHAVGFSARPPFAAGALGVGASGSTAVLPIPAGVVEALPAAAARVTGTRPPRTLVRRHAAEAAAPVWSPRFVSGGEASLQYAGQPIRFAPSELEATEARPCAHCGAPYYADLADIWLDDRALLPTACCEVATALLVEEMREWPRAVWVAFLRDRLGLDIRHVHTGHIPAPGEDRGAPRGGLRDGQWCLDYGLTVMRVPFRFAHAFVRTHHRHNQPPTGWRFGFQAQNGPATVGVIMVGRPVARAIDATRVVEVNRLCVDPTLEPGLVWNACSQLYGAAAREAERLGFHTVLTYTMEDESGASLRSAGFVPATPDLRPAAARNDALTDGGSWSRTARPRADTAPITRKVRWVRALSPSAHARATRAALEHARAARNAARRARRAAAVARAPLPPSDGRAA